MIDSKFTIYLLDYIYGKYYWIILDGIFNFLIIHAVINVYVVCTIIVYLRIKLFEKSWVRIFSILEEKIEYSTKVDKIKKIIKCIWFFE